MFVILYLLSSCSGSMEVATVERKDITEMVFASGTLEAEEMYNLSALTDGYLIQTNFTEGSIISKGSVMAVIENKQNMVNAESAGQLHAIASENMTPKAPALREIKTKIDAAAEKVKLNQKQFERYKRLYELNSVSRVEYENARLALTNSELGLAALHDQYNNQQLNARQVEIAQRFYSKLNQVSLEQNKITAIETGKVYAIKKRVGEYVRKGDVIAIMGDPKNLYAKLNVYETGMSSLRVGQTVIIRLNTNKEKVFKATLKRILPAFDEVTKSFIVEASFDNLPDFRVSGTQLEANINIGTRKNVVVIPLTFLADNNIVITQEGKKKVTVKTGVISGGWVEIKSGVQPGQKIIKASN